MVHLLFIWILSTIVDHEKYYTGTDTADPDDPDYKNDNNFWDYSKHHIAQNISRNFIRFYIQKVAPRFFFLFFVSRFSNVVLFL